MCAKEKLSQPTCYFDNTRICSAQTIPPMRLGFQSLAHFVGVTMNCEATEVSNQRTELCKTVDAVSTLTKTGF